ncbi:ATP-binding cassette, subfamily C (CFTR/MRP), member 1 [Entomortierella parvispora]|uniref:ATP-binding cassette, subfamily C (CFTR/MRP), member 1 n=1 Tax=Entomortierella parvispora TaxID=205924 RepID=A0A9P3HDU7_9FUNG|nr:ATP-binding cassette, subfamily C (CFTR/MRP), member 1 [Entomortierella parvispora]
MGDSYCRDPEGWGPTSSSRPDLTLCFEWTILMALPAFLAILAFTFRAFSLLSQGTRHGHGITWVLYVPSQLLAIGAVAALMTRAVVLSQQDSGYAVSSMLGMGLMIVAWVLSIGLNHLESLFEIRASQYIFSYSAISVIASAITVRTMHDTQQTTQEQFKCFVAFLAINCAHLVVESLPRGRTVVQKKSEASQYEKANMFSRISFHYMQRIISLGYKRPLVQADIDGLMPKRLQAANSHQRLSTRWNASAKKHLAKGTEPSLLRIIMTSFNSQWASILVVRLLTSIMTYVSPQLLNSLLGFITSYSIPGEENKPVTLGIILAFGMFFSSIIVTFFNAQLQAQTVSVGLEVRTALMSMVYRKALRLSNAAKNESSAGQITNLMSVDAERWSMSASFIPMVISVPFEIAIATWMLYMQIGWPILIGLLTVIIMLPVHAKLSGYFQFFRAAKMKAMDSRLKLVNEVLAGMKIVKLYNWEDSFKEKVAVVRRDELKLLKKFGTVFAWVALVFLSTPLVITLVSLAVFATHGGPNFTPGDINPQTIFVSISLFGLISQPISSMSSTLSQITSITVATRRIQKFLLSEELDETMIIREPEDGQDQSSSVVEIQDAVFAWCPEHAPVETEKQKRTREKEEAKAQKELEAKLKKMGKPIPEKKKDSPVDYSPTLVDINLSVPRGQLVAIVGRVGQGKTSLLSALIGEMYKRQGTVRIKGRIAYAAQQAWIVNATLRDNITFGLEYDQEKYDAIVAASGLLPDIAMLPAGDATEIGERGINLSGGQKQRVSLARAAYQDADVYFLDDPLSAVDAHVDQHLWENLIGPNGLLKDKTRLLVTHGIHHLEHVSQIVVVKDGKISENGHYDELMEAQGAFYQLIDEYSINSRKNQKKKASDSDDGENLGSEDEKSDASTEKGDQKETTKDVIKVAPKKEDKAELIAAENMVMGRVSWGVYDIYLRAATYRNSILCVVLYILSQSCQIGTNLWLEHWTSVSPNQARSPGMFLGIYAVITVMYMILSFSVTYVIMVWAGLRATARLHDDLLHSILRLPMSFFDTTPLGRIVNRFSTDIFATDNTLPWSFMALLMYGVSVLGTVIVIACTTPIFLAIVPPLGVGFMLVQSYYIRPSRSLKRIDSTSRSPVYQHFTETLVGVSTIRAMEVDERFIHDNERKSSTSANAYFTYQMVARWLQIRLETLGAVIVLAAALFSVLDRRSLSPGMIGMSLSYAMTVTSTISQLIRNFCDLQNQLVSVERVDEYLNKNPESPQVVDEDNKLPENWPREGRVEFKNYSTRYRQGLDLVIKNINFEVLPAEKVGIVGRTGAGKSSLTLALFRIVEAANSHWAKASHNGADVDTVLSEEEQIVDLEKVEVEEDGGSIWIDGVDISTVGLSRLRRSLAIIPQDPTLFAGTVRENLDPFDELEDAALWEALERAHLKEYISSLSGGLSFKVSQNGDNFSVGQRSLICLARALLRKTKILVLDEATAAVDVETDELIQKTIRKEFKDRTILTIAHRIKTVMDSDKILVLEKGCVEEFESPANLLQNKTSLFYNLAQQAGEIKDEDE